MATDFIPVVSGAKDIYRGAKSGNWWQVGLGVVSIAADVVTMGGSSLAKGAIKTAIKEGGDVALRQLTENTIKKNLTQGGTYVLKNLDDVVVRTGRTRNLAQREKQHKSASDTKDLTFEAVHLTDDYGTQRGLEHMLYEQFKSTASKANGGLNKIKATSDKTLKSRKGLGYLKAAEDFINNLGR